MHVTALPPMPAAAPPPRPSRWLFLLVSFFKLSRAGNVLLLCSAIYLAYLFLLLPGQPIEVKMGNSYLFWSVCATACTTAAGYIINDYFDIQIDRINRPGRILVGGQISRRKVLILHLALASVGVIIGFTVSWRMGLLQFVAANALALYSAYLKRKPFVGNLLVAALSVMGLVVAGIVAREFSPALWFFAGFSFQATLIREIIKDLEDLRGDVRYGCRTLPIVWGIPKTRRLVFVLLGLLLSTLVFSAQALSTTFFFYMAMALFPPILVIGLKLPRADSRVHFRTLSLWCKVLMALGIVGMVFI